MSIIIQMAIALELAYKRTCPKCERDQITQANRKNEAIKCKLCGANIPPHKTHV